MEIDFNSLVNVFITAIVSAGGGAFFMYAKNRKKQFDEITTSVRALLRTDIINYHKEFVVEKGYCSAEMKFTIEETFNEYEKLGGNGTAKELFLEIMRLPSDEEMVGAI